VSAAIAPATLHRIKRSHRRRRKLAAGHLLYILNNPLSGTDPTGYVACGEVSITGGAATGSCDHKLSSGQTVEVDYKISKGGKVSVSASSEGISAIAADNSSRAINGGSKGAGSQSKGPVDNFIRSGGQIKERDGPKMGALKGAIDSASELATGAFGALYNIGDMAFAPQYQVDPNTGLPIYDPLVKPTPIFGEANGVAGGLGYKFGHALITAIATLGPAKGMSNMRGASSVWEMNQFERGFAIEKQLGGNLPSNFPVIDRFDNGIATSIKSIDLNAASYQNAATLQRTLNGYVDKVAAFNGQRWAGTIITPSQVQGRQLLLAVPGRGNAAQQAAIQAASKRAQNAGVQFTTTVVP
jgi:hypothetical protein